MDQIFNANDVHLPQLVLDELVACDRDPLSVYLRESPLVDQLPDRLQVGVAPGDVGLADAQHVYGGLVETDEHAVVDLAQTEELENLAHFRGDFVDTEINLQMY